MAVVDGDGVPHSFSFHDASSAENTLLEEAFDITPDDVLSKQSIGDKPHDDEKLDRRLGERFGVELIAPNRRNRSKTQDARRLRRYERRWKIGRLFAWLGNSCRLVADRGQR